MVQDSQHKKALIVQIREAYGRVLYTYTSHLKIMNRLVKRNKKIKYTQIALSAVSTGGFIGAVVTNEIILTVIGGLFSTILLAINLFFKDFNLSNEIKQHQVASDDLWLIREEYISLLTDFCILSEAEIISKRDDLQKRTYELYKKSPKTDAKSYSEAQKALKSEEEQFFTKDELDKILPEHLRCKSNQL